MPALVLGYVAARGVARGYAAGFVSRSPAILASTLLLTLAFAWADRRAGNLGLDRCTRSDYIAAATLGAFLLAVPIPAFVWRVGNLEAHIDRSLRRDLWPPIARRLDRAAGISLDVTAGLVMVLLVSENLGFGTVPVLEHAIGAVPEPFRNIPGWFGTANDVVGKYGEGCTGPALQFPDALLPFVTLGLAALLAPVVIRLGVESLLFLGCRPDLDPEKAICTRCDGRGVHGLRHPLIAGTACDRCLGSGHEPSSGNVEVPVNTLLLTDESGARLRMSDAFVQLTFQTWLYGIVAFAAAYVVALGNGV